MIHMDILQLEQYDVRTFTLLFQPNVAYQWNSIRESLKGLSSLHLYLHLKTVDQFSRILIVKLARNPFKAFMGIYPNSEFFANIISYASTSASPLLRDYSTLKSCINNLSVCSLLSHSHFVHASYCTNKTVHI